MSPFINALFLKTKCCKILQKSAISYLETLKNKGGIKEKELKYFTVDFKKATNLGRLYLLPEIYKHFSEIPARPAI